MCIQAFISLALWLWWPVRIVFCSGVFILVLLGCLFAHNTLVERGLLCGWEGSGLPVPRRKPASPTPPSEAGQQAFGATQERAVGVQRSAQPTHDSSRGRLSHPGPATPTSELESGDPQNPQNPTSGSEHLKGGLGLTDVPPAAGLPPVEASRSHLDQQGTPHTARPGDVENRPIAEPGQPVSTSTPTGEVSAGGSRPTSAPAAGQLRTRPTRSGAADTK